MKESDKFRFIGLKTVYHFGAFSYGYVSLWRSYKRKKRLRLQALFSTKSVLRTGEIHLRWVKSLLATMIERDLSNEERQRGVFFEDTVEGVVARLR